MKKLLYAVALLGAASLASCEDFLTAENKSAVTDTDYFVTATGFQSLVYDAYGTLDAIYNSSDEPTYFNAGTDLYCDGRNDCDLQLHRWSAFTPENGKVQNFYNACYDGIRAAYAIRHYASSANVPADAKAKAIDEGRFVAALYYYLLVNNFGGVPLVKEYAASAVTGYPRATAAQTYDYIISELTGIIDNGKLKASTASDGGGEASIEAARALLAKTYLSAAWDLNEASYFKKAAEEADKVINGRELTTEFAKLWKADCSGDDDPEFIFDVEYSDNASVHDLQAGNRWQSFYCNYYGGKEEGMKNGGSSYIPTLHALKYFTKEDKRYFATFMPVMLVKKVWPTDLTLFKEGEEALGNYFAFYENGEKADGKAVGVYYPAWWESDDASIAAWKAADAANRAQTFVIPQNDGTYIMEPWANYKMDTKDKISTDPDYDSNNIKLFDFTQPDTHKRSWSTTPCRKFDDSKHPNYDAGRSLRDLHVITLPEIFFVAAEAYLKDNQTDKALARLNSVRKRAGLADETSIDIDKILKESACEMFGNGCRRMDLRRTGKLVEYNNLYNPQLKGVAAETIGQRLLWPIPQAAIDANKAMTSADQNPGY